MKIRNIHVENYKTYQYLDLNLEVTDERPIILIGGANGCGKTTLFDAIYHALYGLKIDNVRHFEELFNAGVKNKSGMTNKHIVLEIVFTGLVLNQEQQYKLKRAYMLADGRVLESVTLNMGGNQFTYGSGSTSAQRAMNEEIVSKIITANLPAELSNYFLFDAMKTSELVKEEQISKLIMKNINSVMGFNKYSQLRKGAEILLAEKKAERLENENQRKEYGNLTKEKQQRENELAVLNDEYTEALNYANDNKQQYEQLKEGKSADDVTKDKMRQLEDTIHNYAKREKDFRQDLDSLVKDFETKVIFPKLANEIRTEVELLLAEKKTVEDAKRNVLSDEQIENISREIITIIETKYLSAGSIDLKSVVAEFKEQQHKHETIDEKHAYLNTINISVLEKLVHSPYINSFIALDDQRERIDLDLHEMPKRKEQLEEYRKILNGSDYSLMEKYEANSERISKLKKTISEKKEEIAKLKQKIATYDYDIPQVPDPQYDTLCKLPEFFKELSAKLLRAKKTSIERMMKEQLNLNLVIYAGYIGRVELSTDNSDEITFKIYHKDGNEIYLSQLNAGAKQTVMQVLLKVLYNLGDYDPPVMIDTVMGVLDKESREVILERYFPDLARQTILLSTDTEITTERDFDKIQAYVAKTYTLHRDKEQQCTTITDDYFGLQPKEF